MIARGKPSLDSKVYDAVLECLDTDNLATGPHIEKFEKAVAEYVGKKYAVATSNGWSAIYLTLRAMGLTALDHGHYAEIIIPNTVCQSVYDAIMATGSMPVMVDCNRIDFNLDVDKVKEAITLYTQAILVPHLRGIPSDIDELLNLEVPIIEDTAQSLGATYNGGQTGSFGIASICSFYPTKIITSIDGGMILTDDEELAYKARSMRYHREEGAKGGAYNFKLNNLNAAVGLAQITNIDRLLKMRKQVYDWYKEFLGTTDMYELIAPNKEPVYDKYLVISGDVKGAKRAMEHADIQPIKSTWVLDGSDKYENTKRLDKTILALPIYPNLTKKEVKKIADTIREFL